MDSLRGETKDGRVSVYNRDFSVKLVTKETLDKYNGPMRVGSIVKTLRSNHLIDDGWEITAFHNNDDPETETTVTIKKMLPTEDGDKLFKKTVALKSLELINENSNS